jgi:hypothetical protein
VFAAFAYRETGQLFPFDAADDGARRKAPKP